MFQNFEPHSHPEFTFLEYYHHENDYVSPQHDHVSQNNFSFLYNQTTQQDHSNQMSHSQPYSSEAFGNSPWSHENEYTQAYSWSPNVSANQDLNESFAPSSDIVPLERPRNDVFVHVDSENHDLKPALFCDTDPSFGEISRESAGDPLQMFHAQGDSSLSFQGLLHDQSNFPPHQFPETDESILPASDSAYLPLLERNIFTKQENLDYMIDDLLFDDQLPFIPHCAQEVNTSGSIISDDLSFKEEEDVSPLNDPNGLMTIFGSTGVTCDGVTFLKLRFEQRKTETILECVSCPTGLAEFSSLNQMSKHISKEHCSKTMICLICKPDTKGMNLSFDDPEEAFEHCSGIHSVSVEKCYFCDNCQMMFFSMESLQSHLETTHPSCSTSKQALKTYRRFPCFLCLHQFKQSGHRKDHYAHVHKLFHKERKIKPTKQLLIEDFKTQEISKSFLPDDLLDSQPDKTNISPESLGPIEQVDPPGEKERVIEMKEPQTIIVAKIKRSKSKNLFKVRRPQSKNLFKVKQPQSKNVFKEKRVMTSNLRSRKNQELNHDLLNIIPERKACEVSSEPLRSSKSDLTTPQEIVPLEETPTKPTLEAPKFYIRPCLIPKLFPNDQYRIVPVTKVPIIKSRRPEMSPALLKRLQVVKQKFSSQSSLLDSPRECSWRKKYSYVFERKCYVSLTNLYKSVPKGENIFRLTSPKVILSRLDNQIYR